MDSNISGKIRKEIINEYKNTGTSVRSIAKKHNLSTEQVIEILEIYKSLYGDIPRNLNRIRDDEEKNQKIYELRIKGLSYEKIVEELEKQGIKISMNTLINRCKQIFYLKGETEDQVINQERNKAINQAIYDLRIQGLSYEAIKETLEKQGIKMCTQTLSNRCKQIFYSKGETEEQAINKLIYDLRVQGLTYEAIKESLEKKGIKLSAHTIGKKCKGIKVLKKRKITRKRSIESQQLDEEIYDLREQGLSFGKIAAKLSESGTILTRQGVEGRYKRFLKTKKEQLIKAIINLTITRKATMKQIQQIANYYGVDLEETLNSIEER